MFIGLLEYGTFFYDDDTVEHVKVLKAHRKKKSQVWVRVQTTKKNEKKNTNVISNKVMNT